MKEFLTLNDDFFKEKTTKNVVNDLSSIIIEKYSPKIVKIEARRKTTFKKLTFIPSDGSIEERNNNPLSIPPPFSGKRKAGTILKIPSKQVFDFQKNEK